MNLSLAILHVFLYPFFYKENPLKTQHPIRIVVYLFLAIGIYLAPQSLWADDPVKKADSAQQQEKAKTGDAVVAKINGAAIKDSELTKNINQIFAQNPQMAAIASSEDQMKDLRMKVLQDLITTEVLSQEGKKQKIKDLDQQVDETYKKLRASLPKEEDFQAALKEHNITEKDLRKDIEKEVRIQKVVNDQIGEIKKNVSISEQEVQSFYNDPANKDKFMQKESVKASHILIKVAKDATKEDDAKAQKKIKDLLKRAKKGEDFAKLAKENSEDPSAAQNSGELGYFSTEDMVPEFATAAFAMKPGEISDVVKTPFGYHIIKSEDKKPAQMVPYDEVKDKISKFLENSAIQSKLLEYIDSLKNSAKIEVLLK